VNTRLPPKGPRFDAFVSLGGAVAEDGVVVVVVVEEEEDEEEVEDEDNEKDDEVWSLEQPRTTGTLAIDRQMGAPSVLMTFRRISVLAARGLSRGSKMSTGASMEAGGTVPFIT